MHHETLRFLTFLAPNLQQVYEALIAFIGRQMGVEAVLQVGQAYEEALQPTNSFSLICGLPYVLLDRQSPGYLEPLAGPVLSGTRYHGRPIYFSDVIVRKQSGIERFQDLRGKSWVFNEPESQSGYGIVRQRLIELGEVEGFFSEVVQSGWHEESIRWVREGRVDASAIDSQVLSIAQRDDPTLTEDLRIVDSLGPSPIQPLVVQRSLPRAFKQGVREVLISASKDEAGKEVLKRGLIDRFTAVEVRDYDDIRTMLALAEKQDFLEIR